MHRFLAGLVLLLLCVTAAVAEAREREHAPAGHPHELLREVAPQRDRSEPLVQEHDARTSGRRGSGKVGVELAIVVRRDANGLGMHEGRC